jgi:CheY-like chemotaxis protein
MTLRRLKRWSLIVLGGIAAAAVLAAVPFYGLIDGALRSRLPGYVASVLALALAVLLWRSIEVESRPGKGSTFWFLLPLKVAADETVPASQQPAAGPLLPSVPACGRRVLIVEDNPINQIVALRALTGLGYQAELAPGGEEALAAFARDHFDAILMDCQMPGMDGYQVASEMRRMEALATAAKPTPIIAMTANVIEGDQQKCVAAGMNDYLSKPMRLAPLARALERWTAPATASLVS